MIEVYSLSPSERSSQLFLEEISTLITTYGNPNKKIPKQDPNDRSVVLYIKFGTHEAILGADLELHPNNDLGWSAISKHSVAIKDGNVGYFKISHHGSENGYCPIFWSKFVTKDTLGALTPWNLNKKLPQNDMIEKYNSLSSQLYITSNTILNSKPKKRDNKIAKTLKRLNESLQEIKFHYGIITSSIEITDVDAKWQTTLEGTAHNLKD